MVYDQTLGVLRQAVQGARLGNDERLSALRRLDDQCRLAEAAAEGRPLPSLPALLHEERALSADRGGRTVFDDVAERGRSARPQPRQLSLFGSPRPPDDGRA